MYPGGDSNSHVLRHTHLKRTCIPFQHLDKYTFWHQPKQTLELKHKNDNYFCITVIIYELQSNIKSYLNDWILIGRKGSLIYIIKYGSHKTSIFRKLLSIAPT